jgi:hypothetical protein
MEQPRSWSPTDGGVRELISNRVKCEGSCRGPESAMIAVVRALDPMAEAGARSAFLDSIKFPPSGRSSVVKYYSVRKPRI